MMQLRIEIHSIFLYQNTSHVKIALTLDTLDFSQQVCKSMTESRIIGNLDVPMQLRAFDLLLDQVEHGLDGARKRQEKDGKLYQTLGIGIGAGYLIVRRQQVNV